MPRSTQELRQRLKRVVCNLFAKCAAIAPPTAARGATEPQRTSNIMSWMSPTWPCSPRSLLLPCAGHSTRESSAGQSVAQRPACSGRKLNSHSTARTFPTGRRPSQADSATCRTASGALKNSSTAFVLTGKATKHSQTHHTPGQQLPSAAAGS